MQIMPINEPLEVETKGLKKLKSAKTPQVDAKVAKKEKITGWKLKKIPDNRIVLSDLNQTKLLNAFTFRVEGDKMFGYMCVVTEDKFYIFDQNYKLKFIHSGYNISSVRLADNHFIYAVLDFKNDILVENCETKELKTLNKNQSSGLYIFDFE